MSPALLLLLLSAVDVRIGGEVRARGEALENPNFRSDRDEDLSFGSLRTRIDLDAILTDRLDAVVRATDVRLGGDFGSTPGNATTYLERAFLESHGWWGDRVSLRLGRQPIEVADGRIVSTSDWGNVPRAFDGVRIDARLTRLRAQGFAAEVVEGELRGGAGVIEDRHLLGFVLEPEVRGLEHAELYGLTLLDDRGLGAGGRDQEIHTIGARVGAAPAARWQATLQGNLQFGENGSRDQRAWLAHARVLYRVGRRYLRSVSADWSEASGDGAPSDAATRTWNPIAPSNHERYGSADLVGPRNLRVLRLGLRGDLSRTWSWGLDLRRLERAHAADDLYRANGTGRGLAGRGGRGIGDEVDAILRWSPNRRVEFEGGASRLFLDEDAATAVRSVGGRPSDASFGYIMTTVTF